MIIINIDFVVKFKAEDSIADIDNDDNNNNSNNENNYENCIYYSIICSNTCSMYICIKKDKIIITIITEIENVYYFYINVCIILCVNNKVSHKVLQLVQ